MLFYLESPTALDQVRVLFQSAIKFSRRMVFLLSRIRAIFPISSSSRLMGKIQGSSWAFPLVLVVRESGPRRKSRRPVQPWRMLGPSFQSDGSAAPTASGPGPRERSILTAIPNQAVAHWKPLAFSGENLESRPASPSLQPTVHQC